MNAPPAAPITKEIISEVKTLIIAIRAYKANNIGEKILNFPTEKPAMTAMPIIIMCWTISEIITVGSQIRSGIKEIREKRTPNKVSTPMKKPEKAEK